ncbi:hypothetical protein ACQY0O_001010 [Thecaphora frezii]
MSESSLYAVADFCLIPMATSTPSVGDYITECQRVLESMKDQGICYQLHGYGTNLEGPFALVCQAIERCHEAVHRMGVPRIATDVRIGTRTDKPAPTVAAESAVAAASKGNDNADAGDEDWSRGLSENERKKQSVLRRLGKAV